MLDIFPLQCSCGGMNGSYVYMYCWGLYLGMFVLYRVFGRGWDGIQGCSPCLCEFNMYHVGVPRVRLVLNGHCKALICYV